MNNLYFLTRQSANLMEDFDREIRRGSAMYLLHGQAGVGKSRLLRELEARRLADLAPAFVDFAAETAVDEDAGGESALPQAERIESLFDGAAPGALLIVDHFEQGSRKSRHQLLQCWATDGIDKKMNLVVAVDDDGVDEVRQLAQQFQVSVNGYRLAPLNAAEIEAFAGFYLFPERPVGQLRIPGALRRRLRRSRGLVAELRDILDRDGAAVMNAEAADSPRAAGLRLLGVLLILVLAAVLAWYSLGPSDAVARPPATGGAER